MKKLMLCSALLLSGFAFANNAEKDNSSINENSILEQRTSEEEVACAWSVTTTFYHTVTRNYFSMYGSGTETTIEVDYTCTTCYQMGHSGVTSSTTCN